MDGLKFHIEKNMGRLSILEIKIYSRLTKSDDGIYPIPFETLERF